MVSIGGPNPPSLGPSPSGATKIANNVMDNAESYWCTMRAGEWECCNALARVRNAIEIIERAGDTNEQYFLNWLDELNKLSVRY